MNDTSDVPPRPTILDEVVERVAYVTDSNPRWRNGMTRSMWAQSTAVLQRLDTDNSVRVVVLRGNGEEAFVSVADIWEFGGQFVEMAARRE